MRNRTFGHHYGPWMAPFPGHFAFDFDPRGRGRGRGGRGRGRRNRGDVRAALLALLNERPMHGYEMIQELDDRTGGIWRPSPGSVYPTLQLLEDEGLITSETSEGRKRFTLTDAGREEAAVTEFRKASFGVMNALGQVGFSGSDEQRARALEVLAETRRKLYAILAEDDAESV